MAKIIVIDDDGKTTEWNIDPSTLYVSESREVELVYPDPDDPNFLECYGRPVGQKCGPSTITLTGVLECNGQGDVQ